MALTVYFYLQYFRNMQTSLEVLLVGSLFAISFQPLTYYM